MEFSNFRSNIRQEAPSLVTDSIQPPPSREREFQLWHSPLLSVFNSTSTSIPRTRLSLPSNIQHGVFKVIGSCNGILCLSFGEYNNSVMVWNPSITKFKILPHLENQPELKGFNDHTVYRFGYDRLADNYKVVAFYCYKEVGRFRWVCKKVQVNTLGTDIWKPIQGLPSAFPFGFGFTLGNCGIFLRGTVNWLGFLGTTFSPWVIFSFDLGNKSYQELLPPNDGAVDVHTMRLSVLRDCLCILSHNCIDTNIHVWLMEDYGNKDSWIKLFVVTFEELSSTPVYPLYILDDDQLLLDFIGTMKLYNSRNRTSKILN